MKTPKWIDETQSILWNDGEWEKEDGLPWTKVLGVLERINSLLRRAMLETDDESLHEEIKEEIG